MFSESSAQSSSHSAPHGAIVSGALHPLCCNSSPTKSFCSNNNIIICKVSDLSYRQLPPVTLQVGIVLFFVSVNYVLAFHIKSWLCSYSFIPRLVALELRSAALPFTNTSQAVAALCRHYEHKAAGTVSALVEVLAVMRCLRCGT